MPIYVYQRPDGSTFEKIQRISEPDLEICPDTGVKVKKMISSSTPIFKGSGFYQTDYCSNGSTKKASTGTDSKEKTATTSESKPKSCGTGCGCH